MRIFKSQILYIFNLFTELHVTGPESLRQNLTDLTGLLIRDEYKLRPNYVRLLFNLFFKL